MCTSVTMLCHEPAVWFGIDRTLPLDHAGNRGGNRLERCPEHRSSHPVRLTQVVTPQAVCHEVTRYCRSRSHRCGGDIDRLRTHVLMAVTSCQGFYERMFAYVRSFSVAFGVASGEAYVHYFGADHETDCAGLPRWAAPLEVGQASFACRSRGPEYTSGAVLLAD